MAFNSILQSYDQVFAPMDQGNTIPRSWVDQVEVAEDDESVSHGSGTPNHEGSLRMIPAWRGKSLTMDRLENPLNSSLKM